MDNLRITSRRGAWAAVLALVALAAGPLTDLVITGQILYGRADGAEVAAVTDIVMVYENNPAFNCALQAFPDVGAHLAGTVNVYKYDGSDWAAYGTQIVGSGANNYGSAVSLSDDGKVLAVGAVAWNSNMGYVQVYSLDDSNPDPSLGS